MANALTEAWHKHPYIILIGGGAVALYILWPRKSTAAPSGPSDYQAQLAAQEALSATQLQTQAQVAQTKMGVNAAAWAAYAQSVGASNAGIAQANAQAILGGYQLAATQSQAVAGVLSTEALARAQSLHDMANVLISWGNNQQAIAGYQAQEVSSLFQNLGPQGLVQVQNNLPIWISMLTGGGTLSGMTGQMTSGTVDTTLTSSSTTTTNQPLLAPVERDSAGRFFLRNRDLESLQTQDVTATTSQEAFSHTTTNSLSSTTNTYNFSYTPGLTAFSPSLLQSLWSSLVNAFTGSPLEPVGSIAISAPPTAYAGQLTQLQPFPGV